MYSITVKIFITVIYASCFAKPLVGPYLIIKRTRSK